MSDEESSSESSEEDKKVMKESSKPVRAKKSSSSESEESSEEEAPKKSTAAADKQKRRYDHSESESDEENEGRVVKTAKDKAIDQITRAAKELRGNLGTDDWPKTKELFESLNKILSKNQKGLQGHPTPESYVETMVALEDKIKALDEDKDSQKRISQLRYKAFNALRSTLPKHLQPYREQMNVVREKNLEVEEDQAKEEGASEEESENSSTSSSSSESSDSSESGSDEEESGSKSSSEDEDDDSESSSSSDFESGSSSSSSSDEETQKYKGRDKWVKRAILQKEPQKAASAQTAAEAEDIKRQRKLRLAEERRKEKIAEEKERKAREASIVLTSRDVERLVMATASRMWKRDANRRELSELLRGHVSRAVPFGPRVLLPALMHLISSQFDARNIDDCMSLDRWRSAVNDLHFILRLLSENPNLRLAPMAADETLDSAGGLVGSTGASETVEQILAEATRASQGDAEAIQARDKALALDKQKSIENPNVVYVVGDISAFASRLATELNKALKNTPAHSSEFLERVQDESTLLDLAQAVQEFLLRVDDKAGAAKQALLRVELMYYKHDSIAIPAHVAHFRQLTLGQAWHPAALTGFVGDTSFIDEDTSKCSPVARPVLIPAPDLDTAQTIADLCKFVYQYGDASGQTRALLCQIYHHALHDHYHKARDLLLMSRIQDNIHLMEAETQILFNRVTVQLGLCAFRAGMLRDAHTCLQEICGQGRAKELLAQGVSWRKPFEQRDMERENLERRRLIPYHMHIDLDLLECCHLTSAMVLEMSNLAASDNKAIHHDDRYHNQDDVISRPFRRYLDAYERAVFTGPPENIRDHIMASAVALREGDWKTSADHILSLPVWDTVPSSGQVKEMLQMKIKTEAIRVYLLTFAAYYESVRLDALCELFSLDRSSVQAVLAKLILSRTLHASWDEETVRLHKIVPTNLQALALQFADKAREFVESNEKTMDRLTGGSGENRRDRDDTEKRVWKPRERRSGGAGFQNRNNTRGTGGGMLVDRYRADRSRSSTNKTNCENRETPAAIR